MEDADAAQRRVRAVAAHLQPPPATPAAGRGLAANPTAGEYAHGASPYPCVSFHLLLLPVLPSRVAMPPTWNPRCGRWELDGPLLRRVGQQPSPDSGVVGMWRGGPCPRPYWSSYGGLASESGGAGQFLRLGLWQRHSL